MSNGLNGLHTGRRAGPPQARPDPPGGSITVFGDRGAIMIHPVSTACIRAAAPGRPKQGPTLPEGRSPYSVIGVQS